MTGQPETRASLAALLFLACTLIGAILAVELWHWRWALYGFLTALFVAAYVSTRPDRPTRPGCPWCGGPAQPSDPPT